MIEQFKLLQTSPTRETRSQANSNIPGCLSSSTDSNSRRKGDFVLQTGHVIEIVTKLFLVNFDILNEAEFFIYFALEIYTHNHEEISV